MVCFSKALLVLTALAKVSQGAQNFFSLGDWGAQTVDSAAKAAQSAVAAQMGTQASTRHPSFIVNVGDNFYHIGVNSTTDPLWQTDFRDVYTAPGLQVPWLSILGNHDYGLNPGAQTQYTADPRWVMPSRYYSHKEGNISFIFLDTNPCYSPYRSSDRSGWDPNTPEFHANIIAQQCGPQATWFESEIAKVPKADWLIVVGHHPAPEVDGFDLVTLLDKYNADLYICGHDHLLEHYRVNSSPMDHIISGAGGRVNLAGKGPDQPNLTKKDIIWSKTVAGFASHHINDASTTLTTDFIDYKGNVVYTLTTHKRH
eukprot:TRINITY_DN93861_c0_g1_i1.p1 TRINITY_DN93861_c0_g1~~TRINITY_DN93861_c0_g1_i1.p1  ORF type:complete len:320 (-),score=60.35 TRINITY_DN93861_c0_g1_i1:93-1031(-)